MAEVRFVLRAVHRTVYEYPWPAENSYNEVRLMPMTDATQRCIAFDLAIKPPTKVYRYDDVGGAVHYFNVREPHDLLEIRATSEVEMMAFNPFNGLNLLEPDWDFYGRDEVRQDAAEFLGDSTYVTLLPESTKIAADLLKSDQSAAAFLIELNGHLNRLLEYDPDATHVHSTLQEVLLLRAGVCQDYSHLMIACCRGVGIPARYVSGYLFGGNGIRGEMGTHAWVECLLPDGRWLALDPTNDLLANEHHIRVHVGRDYAEVAPTRGVYIGAPAAKLEFGVRVEEVTPQAVSA